MKSIRRNKKASRDLLASDTLEISSSFYAWLQKCVASIEKRGLQSEV